MTDRCENCIHVQMCKWTDEMVANHTCDWYEEDRPHGEWVWKLDEETGESGWNCSVCNEFGDCKSPYCPNCGADMRVKNELNRVKNELNRVKNELNEELNSENTTLLYSITNGDNFIGKEGEEK